MLRPSYTELMKVLNEDADLDNKITSRYTIVIAAAKRARQIIDGGQQTVGNKKKAVSLAVSEIGDGLIDLYPEGLPLVEVKETIKMEDMPERQPSSKEPLDDPDMLFAMNDDCLLDDMLEMNDLGDE